MSRPPSDLDDYLDWQARIESFKASGLDAKRGEYVGEAPLGYIRTRNGIEVEPDAQAQGAVRLIFTKFAELGSAHAVLKFFHDEGIQIGRRVSNGPQPVEMTWGRANRSTILYVLRHPSYAGAYVYGRSKSVTIGGPDGARKTVQRRVGKEEWQVLIRDKIPAYIKWQQWERNQQKLRENSTKFGCGRSRGASIPAGRIACGTCGASMPAYLNETVLGTAPVAPAFSGLNTSVTDGGW